MPVWNFSFSLQVGRRQQNRPNQPQAENPNGITEAALQNATINIESFQQLRNRLFHHMFHKFSLTYARFVPLEVRRWIEFIFLLKAVGALALLIYIHVAFTKMPCDCLSGYYYEKWPKDGILRVDIQFKNDSYTLEESYAKEWYYVTMEAEGAEDFEQLERDGIITKLNQEHGEPEKNDDESEAVCGRNVIYHEERDQFGNVTSFFYEDVVKRTCFFEEVPEQEAVVKGKMYSTRDWPRNYHILEFAMEYGLLRLSPKTRERLKVPVMLVTIDPLDENCFGNLFSNLLLEFFLGYDNVLMGALRSIAEKEEGKGYLRNALTGDHFKFVNLRMSPASYFSSFFVMIVFTLSVSLLLRYSHHQIFVFIVNLLHLLEFNTALVFPAGPLLAIVLALIGIEAIMSDFFSDTTTAFYVILILWVAEHFDALCSQSNIVKRHWLRFFFLYHYAFYAYHYRFSGQNGSLALVTSWFFIQHSMLYFYHHYELPLILRQNHVQEVVRRQVEQFSFVRQTHRYQPASLRIPMETPTTQTTQEVPLLAPTPVQPPANQVPLDDREITRLVDELSSTFASQTSDTQEEGLVSELDPEAPTLGGAAVVSNLDPTRVYLELEPDGILLEEPVLD